jgi:DNA-binding NarL/FixJ family response regulator
MSEKKITVLLADDHTGVLAALAELLQPDFVILRSVADGEAVIEAARELKPDLIVMDISMPLLDGISAAKIIRTSGIQSEIVFLTMHEDPDYLSCALEAGASGYVVKRRMFSDLRLAIEEALAGRTFVSSSLQSLKGSSPDD